MDSATFAARWATIVGDQPSAAWIDEVAALYLECDSNQRRLIRTNAVGDQWRRQVCTSWARAHDEGIKRNVERWIRLALIWWSIGDAREDIREDLISLCQLYHEGWFAGVNVNHLIEEVARVSSDDYATLLRGFIARSPEMKSLKAFGWKWVMGPVGPYVADQACTYPTIDNITELRQQKLGENSNL
jgi:hypothetical protein